MGGIRRGVLVWAGVSSAGALAPVLQVILDSCANVGQAFPYEHR